MPDGPLDAKRRERHDRRRRRRSRLESKVLPAGRTDCCALQDLRPAVRAGARGTCRSPSNRAHDA
jgi:hypothetical protein